MADGKWVSGLTAEMELVEAARRVLEVRLRVVGEYLPRVERADPTDTENVHQLRVATRRAGAALRIFKVCLPHKVARRAGQRLRRIRRAAGAARDWDVFRLDLVERRHGQPAKLQRAFDFLIGYAVGQRQAAQPALEDAARAYGPEFDSFSAGVLEALRPPDEESGLQTLADLARPMLAELLEELEREVAGDLTDYEHLHQVRITGKRLRYALELCACCFGPELRESWYPLVEEMQETLGRANDSHVAGERLKALREHLEQGLPEQWRRVHQGLEKLLASHRQRLPQERERFLEWWPGWRKLDVPGAVSTAQAAPGGPGAAWAESGRPTS